MMLRKHLTLFVMVLGALAVSMATAQVKPGDYILGALNGSGLYALDRMTGAVTTITKRPVGHFVGDITMDINNRDILAIECIRLSRLLRVDPTGKTTSIAVVSTFAHRSTGIELDETGNYVASATDRSSFSLLARVARTGSVSTIISPTGRLFFGVAIDGVTGDYLVPCFWTGVLWRVSRRTHAITTLANGMNWATSINFEPRTGGYIVTWAGQTTASGGFFRVPMGGGITTTINALGYSSTARVDHETGTLHLAGGAGTCEMTRTGTVIRSHARPPSLYWSSIQVYGSRKVCGSGSGKAGSTYTFHFSFPTAGAGAVYRGALSLTGLQPGIRLPGGRQINLVIDDLTRLMLVSGDIPGLTAGFAGRLDSAAAAMATVKIPSGIPPGLRVWATAVAFSIKAPGGIETGNTWAFTTQ